MLSSRFPQAVFQAAHDICCDNPFKLTLIGICLGSKVLALDIREIFKLAITTIRNNEFYEVLHMVQDNYQICPRIVTAYAPTITDRCSTRMSVELGTVL